MRSSDTLIAERTPEETLETGREILRITGRLGDIEGHIRLLRTTFPQFAKAIEATPLPDEIQDGVIEFMVIKVMELFAEHFEVSEWIDSSLTVDATNHNKIPVNEKALWFDVAGATEEFFGLSEHGVSLVSGYVDV